MRDIICYEIKETDLTECNIALQITTDKQAYGLGEVVIIEIENNGNQTLIFPDLTMRLLA